MKPAIEIGWAEGAEERLKEACEVIRRHSDLMERFMDLRPGGQLDVERGKRLLMDAMRILQGMPFVAPELHLEQMGHVSAMLRDVLEVLERR